MFSKVVILNTETLKKEKSGHASDLLCYRYPVLSASGLPGKCTHLLPDPHVFSVSAMFRSAHE